MPSNSPIRRRCSRCCWLLLLLLLPGSRAAGDAPVTAAPAGPPASSTPPITLPAGDERLETLLAGRMAPASKDDLRVLEARLQAIAAAVLPCTVGVQLGGGSGSGVIVSEDGFVLTAGHVSGKPGQQVTIVLQDGRRVTGKTLGANFGIDSGLIKIDGDEKWPHAELGRSRDLALGAWCVAAGHPGGFQPGRTSPIRAGRVLANQPGAIVTDCMLVGGDSGGPLFDGRARVIGINSRIGGTVAENVCVPVDTYRDTWPRLAAGEAWGLPSRKGEPFIGLSGEDAEDGVRVTSVQPGSPADKAGLQVDDVLRRFGGGPIASFEALVKAVRASKPGASVAVDVQRGDERRTFTVIIGKRTE